jgi:DnaJ domain
MSINPLIPYIPAFLSFFIYGYLSGFLFLLWKRSRWGCLLTIIFWYLYAAWCSFFGLLLGVETTSRQAWFAFGLFLAFLRPLLQSVAVRHFLEDISHAGYLGRRAWQTVTSTRTNKTKHDNRNNHQSQQKHHQANDFSEQARRAEQARREAEARARRAEKEKENQQSRAQDQKPEPPTADTRTPEEILGLKAGWTQEDLRKIYKSESQRTHPDKWIGKPQAIRHAMEEEYKNIQQAYHQLKT